MDAIKIYNLRTIDIGPYIGSVGQSYLLIQVAFRIRRRYICCLTSAYSKDKIFPSLYRIIDRIATGITSCAAAISVILHCP
jgi:hypothetical protein